jgi:hypothetical protein
MSDTPEIKPHASAEPAARTSVAPSRPLPLLRRLASIGSIAIVAVIGLFGAGFGTGWVTSNNIATAGPENTAPTPTTAPNIPGFSASVLMPDVRGLTPDDAKQVLADAGIDIATVTAKSRPSAGLSGLIVAQVPAFGAGNPSTVSLVVSTPAIVPSVIGQSATDAITSLSALGAQIQRVSVFVPGATIGKVTAINPAPGLPLPEIVTLSVTAVPASLNLATLHISGECGASNTATMNGKDWSNAVTCSSSSSGASAFWAVGKSVDQITGTLGIADRENSSASATVQIMGDGIALGTYNLVRGTPATFTLATTGVATLTVRMVSTNTNPPNVVIGDFTALSSSAALATLNKP